jgi:hypothetical protein
MANVAQDVTSKVTLIPLEDSWFSEAKVSPVAKAHLESSLESLQSAQDHTPTFKLYGSDSNEVIERFLDSVDWDNVIVPDGWKEYEYSRLKKAGPQGGHPSWKEMEPLFFLYQERLSPVSFVDQEIMQECIDDISRCFHQQIKPRNADSSLAKLISKDKIFNTAAGCRDFNLKKTSLIAQIHAVKDYESGLADHFRMYTFEKFQKQKPRIFMPGAFSHMIDQARYCVPRLERIQQDLRERGAYSSMYSFGDKIGFDPLFHDIMAAKFEIELKYLKRRLIQNRRRFDLKKVKILYVQGDFEKMDTTTGTDQYNKLYLPQTDHTVLPEFRADHRRSMLLTTTVPIISPSGVMIGDHGTGSGMENTNEGECYCNKYYKKRTNKKFSHKMKRKLPHVIYVFAGDFENGDDSTSNLIIYDVSDSDLEIIKSLYQAAAEEAARECGFRINDKWRMDCNFGLYCQEGYWFSIDSNLHVTCHYMYPAALILNSIINPLKEYSRADWDKDFRDIDVAEKLDNGKYLPYFTQLIDYVDNGMKYPLLGRRERETYRILSKFERYRALQSQDERWNKSEFNISSSPVLNYVMAKRNFKLRRLSRR